MSIAAPPHAPRPPMPRRFIAELRPSERVRGIFAICNAQLGRTRGDKPYLRCLICDRSGEMPGRMWSIDEPTFGRIPTDGFVVLEGETQAYQGEMQLIIQTIDPAEPSPDELRDLLPASKRDPEEMFAELKALLATVGHPAIRALVQAYLSDEHLVSAFKRCPAAKSVHHAWLGGLLEHTLTLLHLADRVCPLYPKINRDLVMMGLFIHDIGKTRELTFDRSFSYTDRGELVGHVVDGVIILREKAQQMIRESGIRVPPAALMALEHIVLSHHGLPEFGAAKIPATPEAIVVSMLDNLDAKTSIAVCTARPDRPSGINLGGNFTERQWALDTKLFRPDPLSDGPAPRPGA